jgi:pyruvate kinase
VIEQAERELCAHGMAKPGDDIIVTYGVVLWDEPFQTNMLTLHKIRS